jgi:hypothetical protein
MKTTNVLACSVIVLLAALAPANPAGAATDWKAVHGSECVAAGANTTPAELTTGAYGIANPGTTDELVICPMPIDANVFWGESGEESGVLVRFRAGSVSGRIICSVFNGAAGAQDPPVVTATGTSIVQPANSPVSSLELTILAPNFSSAYADTPPISVACLIGPKIKLGGLFLVERVATPAQ